MVDGNGESARSAKRRGTCADCGAQLPPRQQNRFYPFCSERCQLSDLGHWLNEDYRIPDA